LCSELRLAGVCTLEAANAFLERYRPEYNRRFAKPARDAKSAWRPVHAGTDLERVCAFRYQATVHNDNTIRLSGLLLQIPPGPGRRSYAKSRVDVRQLLDGSWRVYLGDQVIATRGPSPLEATAPRDVRKRSAASRAFRKSIAGRAASLP